MTETTREFLERRRRELEQQLSALDGQMYALRDQAEARKSEIAEIDRAIAAIGPPTRVSFDCGGGVEIAPPIIGSPVIQTAPPPQQAGTTLAGSGSFSASAVVLRGYDTMTIKELVIQALLDHFPEGGSAAAIREFIKNAYGKEIDPGTLRPQMHRLKEGDAITYDPEKDVWKLSRIELSGRAQVRVRARMAAAERTAKQTIAGGGGLED
jgi:hypothetical protein